MDMKTYEDASKVYKKINKLDRDIEILKRILSSIQETAFFRCGEYEIRLSHDEIVTIIRQKEATVKTLEDYFSDL